MSRSLALSGCMLLSLVMSRSQAAVAQVRDAGGDIAAGPATSARRVPGPVCRDSVAAPDQGVMTNADCAVLVHARARHLTTLPVLVVAREGRLGDAMRVLRRLGATVHFHDDRTAYARAHVSPEQVELLARAPAVELLEPVDVPDSAWVDRSARVQDSLSAALSPKPAPAAAGNAAVSGERPYMALREIGVDRLRATHPTFDGRGAVIAVVENLGDVLHPELTWGRLLDGRRVPKLLDSHTASDPEEPGDGWWVDLHTRVTPRGGSVVYQGTTYHLPRAAGPFRIGRFVDWHIAALVARARPADPPSSPRDSAFAVLWEPRSNQVWVDTDQDHDFGNESALEAYGARRDLGVFGRRDGPLDQRAGFVVQIDRARAKVHLDVASAMHGTMVASTAAGNTLSGGLFDGVAPAAQLVAVSPFEGWAPNGRQRVRSYGYIEAVILAARDPRVDVINCSFGVADPATGAISRAADVVFSRTVAAYHRPIVQSLGTGSNVIGAAVYASAEMFRQNFHLDGEPADWDWDSRMPNLQHVGRGSALFGDGRILFDFVAPAASIAASAAIEPGSEAFASFGLRWPAGYMIGSGASQAAPMVSGVLAVLISAARQAHVPYDVPRLVAALRTGARWVSPPDPSQASLLAQADGAWRALQAMAHRAPPAITVDAPIELSGAPRRAGLGLVVDVPDTGSTRRTVWLTRRTGPEGAIAYRVRWLGNDGTFTTPDAIRLPRGVAAPLAVRITPGSAGEHVALAQLVDPVDSIVVQQVGVTASRPLLPVDIGSAVASDTLRVGQHGSEIMPFDVAPGATTELAVATPDTTLEFALLGPDRSFALVGPHALAPWGPLTGVTSRELPAEHSGFSRYVVRFTGAVPGRWQLRVTWPSPWEQGPHTHSGPVRPVPIALAVTQCPAPPAVRTVAAQAACVR